MASEIRVNQIQNRSGLSTVTFSESGVVISGVTTVSGSLNVSGNITGNLTGSVNLTSGITTVAAGSTSAPSITPTGDSNTGIFFPSADTIAFAEGGSEAARFDSNGRLGIGTVGPTTTFEVHSNTNATHNIATLRSINVQLKIGTTDLGNGEVTYNSFPSNNSSGAGAHIWQSGGTERLRINSSGHTLPGADNTYDLGSTSFRWRNVFTTDLQLSNEGSKNDVDGTWGSWTLQEGEDDVFLINRRNGKKYKISLTEVN